MDEAQPNVAEAGDPASVAALPERTLPLRRTHQWDVLDASTKRILLLETALILGISLGRSAIYSLLSLIEKLTRPESLGSQTTTINNSVVPDRPWLDVMYLVTDYLIPLVPALLALFLIKNLFPPSDAPYRLMGLDATRPGRDVAQAFAIAAAIGIPGLAFYVFAKAIGINTTIAAANLTDHWGRIPLLVLSAFRAGFTEEVIMVGYLGTRWAQLNWGPWRWILTSAAIRGGYHLYQGFGGAIGNFVMGVAFGWFYVKTGRLWPLILAHLLLDVVSFVGYALLHNVLSWL
ncbi:MAG: CPBP family intramembrane metalloprotease [Propionibacteriaceae bacterium]|jgi:membrane protease YdiL (CAAX protease family)|nr:CPBP family intramembrane metalloprotease [Propionibacteriaceae bacterium]